MAENWFNKFVQKKFNQILFDHNTTKEPAFYKLKVSFDFNEKCIIVDQLPVHFEKFIYGTPFPANIKELGSSVYIAESQSFEDEINWFFLSVRKYKEKINEFIILKKKFDDEILLGNNIEAEKILDNIDKTICFSVWSIESRLLLKELIGGFDENKILLSKINEEKRGHFITQLADFYSKKAENDLLINRYTQDIRNFANKFQEPFKIENIEYYYFKVNYLGYESYKTASTISSIEFQNSIIDRYLSFIKLIYNQINSNEIEKKQINVLKSRISYLAKKITDPLISRLLLYLNEDEGIELNETDKEAISILDLYTTGRYNEAARLIKEFLKRTPACYELYSIYAKCLINEKKKFEPITDKINFQNKILSETYSILVKQTNPIAHIQNLRKICYQLSSLSISYQVSNFLLQEGEGLNNNKLERLNFLSSCFVNPLFCNIYAEKSSAKKFIQKLDNLMGANSETIKFLFHNISETIKEGLEDLDIPLDRKDIYTAIYFQKTEKYDDAINIWQSLLFCNIEKPHIYQTIITNLYNCYFEKGDIDKCIALYVKTYFDNQYYIVKLSTINILEKIRKNNFRGIEINVDVPIFYRLANSLETRTTSASEKLFKEYKIKRPTELIEILKLTKELDQSEDRHRKYVFFFDKVCTPDLFKHMVSIKGTKQRLNERLIIINYLMEFDSGNQNKYLDEKEEINRQILIQEGLQANDESKIFINEKLIRNTLLNDIETEFNRYKSISKILEDHSLNFIIFSSDTKHVKAISVKGSEKKNEEISFSTDPTFDLIKGMFLEMRDLFIGSQYGLREYLGGRIRHGVFKSEIRPKFESLKLITEKDSIKKNYKINSYWADRSKQFVPDIQEKLQKALSTFSQSIDNLIEEEVLAKHLHIKTEEIKNEGWFDYKFEDRDLSIYSIILKKCETFQEFTDNIFALLWSRTDKNLEYIRNQFTADIKQEFEKAIVNLELELRSFVPQYCLPELFENITTSKVNIQNDLDRIARWFNRIGNQTKEFSLDKILEISVAYANKGYEKRKIVLKKNIESDFLFKGELYPSFIDLMYSFFKNTLEYCGLEVGEVETEIHIVLEEEKKIILKISNKLYGDIDERVKQFNSYRIDEAKSSDDRRSGLKKAYRTIIYDFGNKQNTLTFGINKEKNTFDVKCVINIENMKYENINN